MDNNTYKRGNSLVGGIILSSSSLLCFLSLMGVFGIFSDTFNDVLYGLFGQSIYALSSSMFLCGLMLLIGRQINLNKSLIALSVLLLILALSALNSATTVEHIAVNSPSDYLFNVYNNGVNTAGGVVNAILISLPMNFLGYSYTLIGFLLLFLLTSLIAYKFIPFNKSNKQEIAQVKSRNKTLSAGLTDIDIPYYDTDDKLDIKVVKKDKKTNNTSHIYNEAGSIPFYKDDNSQPIYAEDIISQDILSEEYQYDNNDKKKKSHFINDASEQIFSNKKVQEDTQDLPFFNSEYAENNDNSKKSAPIRDIYDIPISKVKKPSKTEENMTFDTEKATFVTPNKKKNIEIDPFISKDNAQKENKDRQPAPLPKEKEYVNQSQGAEYVRPPIDMLSDPENNQGQLNDFIREKIFILNDLFKTIEYNARVVATTVGPALIRFELAVDDINITKINYHRELIVAKLKSTVEIHIPLPNKSTIGIDVPSPIRRMVSFKEMIKDDMFWRSKKINFVVGQTVEGNNYYCNIHDMKHMLVAGTTGSGKSVSLNNLLCSLVFKHSPEELKLIIIDPKKMDFLAYNELPHLLFKYVIDETYPAKCAIDWVVEEMERRFRVIASANCNSLEMYNNTMVNKKMPYIVVMIDEFNDLCMSSADKSIIDGIVRIAQKARAAGIHLVVATQRPSADVIKGSLKTNLSTRMALKVSSPIDSQVALGDRGANTLLGNGDMYFRVSADKEHLQAPFISDTEVRDILTFIKENKNSVLDENLVNIIN